jgi:NB-ARC domain
MVAHTWSAVAPASQSQRAYSWPVVLLQLAAQAAGDDESAVYTDFTVSASRLGRPLADQHILLALDDVWSIEDIEPIVIALGNQCRMIVTTIDSHIANVPGPTLQAPGQLDDGEAVALLAGWVGVAHRSRCLVNS